jgi:hypothetical protein
LVSGRFVQYSQLTVIFKGGIVTFTPTVLANHPAEVAEFITKIKGHPLWEGFILPSVLGAAIRMCGFEDAASLEAS